MVIPETTEAGHSVSITAQRWPPVCQGHSDETACPGLDLEHLTTSSAGAAQFLQPQACPGPLGELGLAGPQPQLPTLDTRGREAGDKVNHPCVPRAGV